MTDAIRVPEASPVMPDFADAAGLEALTAAGGAKPSTARSHGDAPKGATSPAAWPPPPTPEPFKVLVRQMDSVGSALAAMLTEAPVTPEPDKFCDEVADGLWPLAFYYGAGADKPSVGMLWTYALASVLGLVAVKVARVKTAKAAAPAPDGGDVKVAG